MFNRREMLSTGLVAAGVIGVGQGKVQAASTADDDGQKLVSVLAELRFPISASERAATALAELAEQTRRERGCLRYVVARDLADKGCFHLSELWEDIDALAAHFATPHMAAFSASARALAYTAPFMKQISVAGIADLNPRELSTIHGG